MREACIETKLKRTIEAYNNSASQYSQTIAALSNYDDTYEYLLCCLKSQSKLLDLACGPANISRYLLEKDDSIDVYGVDLSREMIKLAKSNVPGGMFYEVDIRYFDLEKTFDTIVCGFGVPYLSSDDVFTMFENVYNHLSNDGVFYFSFMHGEKSGYETPSFYPGAEMYIYHHDKNLILKYLDDIGFSVERKWVLDYQEGNGEITKDVVIICRK